MPASAFCTSAKAPLHKTKTSQKSEVKSYQFIFSSSLNNVIETAEKKGEKKGFEMVEKTGFEKGEKTGFEKSIIEGIIESARNMIKAGVDKQTVINALNLTPEIIKEL